MPMRVVVIFFAALLFVSIQINISAQEYNYSKIEASLLEQHSLVYYPINWRYKSGDDINWANNEYVDSSWALTSSLIEKNDTNFSEFRGVSWFRKEFLLDSVLVNKLLSFRIFQAGASQIYIDGVLYDSLGTFSKNSGGEVRDAGRIPRPIKFNNIGPHLIAIRYSNHFYKEYFENERWAGFKFYFGKYDSVLDNFTSAFVMQSNERLFLITVPLLLALIHFSLYLFNRTNTHNLIYVLFLLCFAFYVYLANTGLFVKSFEESIFWYKLAYLSLNLTITLASFAVWSVVDKLPKASWLFVVAAILIGIYGYIDGSDLAAYLSYIFIGIVSAFTGRKLFGPTDVDFRIKKIVIIGFVIMSISGILQMLIAQDLIAAPFGFDVLYFYGVIAFLIFMSIALAREFALTTENLEIKLTEVEKLSEQTIQQEREARAKEVEQKVLQADNERKTNELEEARELQLSMLPKTVPFYEGFEIAVFNKTATEVGGDYYDFNISRQNILNIVVGDATGHGMKAGIMVANVKSLFAALGSNLLIPDFFNRCTEIIKNMGLGNLFMSLAFLRLQNRTIIASCAGMPPLILFSSKEKKVREILIKGMPLGGFRNFPYNTEQFEMEKGDLLLIMSDGLMESFNESKEMFDLARIREIVESNYSQSPQFIIDTLVNEGENWRGGQNLEDDITMMIIKRTN
ncbi:MAG: SpoIIE family protein phosphatase [Melioribacteraceae bacterium]|nr:SpoIIE family protein phosphatase [Melioribacteraceae bacterium]MCF8263824.1 SpoIIE family protein phosphatase [Melioribacteraceae bacterium]